MKGVFHYEVKAILINKRTGLVEAEGIGCCNSKEAKYNRKDSYSIINTLLKMAKKRAFVDAVLSATRSSDIFTQDVEDLVVFNEKADKGKQEKKIAAGEKKATKAQLTKLYKTIKEYNYPIEKAKDIMISRYGVAESQYLSQEQINEFMDLVKCS